MKLAVGPVVGTHRGHLYQTAHLLQPVFSGKKGYFDKNSFCCKAFILSSWETFWKHRLNTLHAQIGKLHLPIQF